MPEVLNGVSVFFPAYNEEGIIKTTVEKAEKAISALFCDYEIIVVDDGSCDRTGEIINQLAEKNYKIRAAHHQVNRGYGAALRTGFSLAGKQLIFYTDGDNQFDIAEISLLLPLLEKADIVAGYRIKRNDPWHRWLFGKMWGSLVGLLFGLWMKDIDCAFKLIKKEVIDAISPLGSDGAVISTELLVKAKLKGFRIKQVGVHHYPRLAGSPTGAKLSVIVKAFLELFKLRAELH